ncbi:MAG: hypothetical protein HQL32_17625, partial [Planctomycetes bacterium]|nr:hypothetical protein [Planctomycetota bacterium]
LVIEKSLQEMQKELKPAYERLKDLAIINPSIKESEIEAARHEMKLLHEGLQRPQLRLDAIRVIACYSSRKRK